VCIAYIAHRLDRGHHEGVRAAPQGVGEQARELVVAVGDGDDRGAGRAPVVAREGLCKQKGNG